ncbi:MAG: O-antigen ligase family protein [Candidatus Gracilibacteria bacterium]|jgi:O-antigen ligase|nr:O-antigen ligase family protein [Candidatus Gracilibacteria bacterium]
MKFLTGKHKNIFFPAIISLAFLGAFIINPFGVNLFELPKQTYLSLFITFSFIFFALKFLQKEKTEIKYNKYALIFASLWIITLFLSSVLGEAPLKSIYGDYIRSSGALSHLLYISYFFIIIHSIEKKSIDAFLRPLLAIGVALSLHAILQKFGLFLIFSPSEIYATGFLGRSFSTFGNPNLLGQFLIFPFFISLYFFIKSKHKKALLFIPVFLHLSAIFLTENRASLLAVFVGIIALIFLSKKIRLRLKILSFLLLTTILATLIFTFTPSTRSLCTRTYLWDIANKAFIENPIFGTGLESFENSFHKYLNPDYYKYENLFSHADRAHNDFLDIESSTGSLGFLIFLSSILLLLTKFLFTKKRTLTQNIIATSLFALLVSNFFSFSLTLNFLSLYTLLALLCILTSKPDKLKLTLTKKTIFLVPLLLIFSLFISTTYLKNLSSDIQFKSAKTNSISPYESLQKAVKLNPNQSDIWFYLAYFLKENGNDFTQALEKAKKFENLNARYLINEARLYENVNSEKALSSLEKATLIAPYNNEIDFLKGKIYFETEKYSKSISSLEKIIEKAPKHLFYSQNEIQRDSVGYFNFIDKNPEILEILDILTQSHKKLGNTEKSQYYKSLKERSF